MEIKAFILTIGMSLLTCYLVFIIRRDKSFAKSFGPKQNFISQKISSKQFSSEPSSLSTQLPILSNRKEFDSFLEKRKLEIFREILRRDHIAQQKRQINKTTCLREILESLLGNQGASEVFEYYGSVELFSEVYKKFLGHIPEEIILKCFEDGQQWETKVKVYEKVKHAILDGSLETIETPKASDVWIVSIYPKSYSQWIQTHRESLQTLLEKIGQEFTSIKQNSNASHSQ
jgi:hypothetical protein